MPATLAETNGKAAMFYTGETPWHGLGTELDGPATSEEALAAAGLDFTVSLQDLLTTDGRAVPMRKAVARDDDGAILGVVGNKWKPVQNREAFAFLDGVVGDGRLRYHTAGALGVGERIWLLAKLPEDIRIKGTDDVVNQFLLLSNNHDGFASLHSFFTPIRVVCANTLAMAYSQHRKAQRNAEKQGRPAVASVSIRHTGDIMSKINEAQRVLGLAETFYRDFAEKADFLASRTPSARAVQAYFEEVFPLPEKPEEQKRAETNARENHQKLHHLFVNGMGQDIPGVKRTWWAAYNAVTELVDHKPLRGTGELEDNREGRLASIWFGSGAQLKGKAFEAAMAMASASN